MGRGGGFGAGRGRAAWERLEDVERGAALVDDDELEELEGVAALIVVLTAAWRQRTGKDLTLLLEEDHVLRRHGVRGTVRDGGGAARQREVWS